MRTNKSGINRLREMPVREIASRATEFALQRRDALLYKMGIGAIASKLNQDGPSGNFFINSEEILEVGSLLQSQYPELTSGIISRADQICEHRFSILGFSDVDFGKTIDWHLDPIHGKQSPLVPWHSVPYFDFEKVGDPKITWELNRHQHLVVLAKAFVISRDDRYLRELVEQFRSWTKANPYPLGINWASSLEVGFRLLSWLWVRNLLAAAGVNDIDSELLHGIALHGSHIRRYLSTYTSPNTHLLGEAVALFAAGAVCREIVDSETWRSEGWRITLEEAKNQVQADGFHFEQSTYYHVYALDFFIHARILAARNGLLIPTWFDETIVRMLQILARLSAGGTVPRFGDDDGGRVFDGTRNRAQHLIDPLGVGTLLYPAAQLRVPEARLTEEALWLLGAKARSEFDSISADRELASNDSEEPGLVVLRSGNHKVTFDLAPQGAGGSGHGHADALSITIASNGYEWLTDPGTYSYSVVEGRRELFRGTKAHNTVEIDGTDQAEAAGPFSWRVIPEVETVYRRHGENFHVVCGAHDGYQRLREPVTHSRWLLVTGNVVLVRDRFEGNGEHAFRSRWHFDRECKVDVRATAALISHQLVGQILLTASGSHWQLGIADSWQSPAYGVNMASPCIQLGAEKNTPCESAVALLPGAEWAEATLSSVPENEHGLQHYRLSTPAGSEEFFFSDVSGQRWQSGRIKSNARVLHIVNSAKGEAELFNVCDGSYLQVGDEELFGSGTSVDFRQLVLRRSQPLV